MFNSTFSASFNNSPATVGLYTMRDLRARGWTRRLIERFLGSHDAAAANPHIQRGRPMKFFDPARVHLVETEADFGIQAEASQAKKLSAQKTVDSKTKALSKLAEEIEPALPGWSVRELSDQGILWANEHGIQTVYQAQISAIVNYCQSCEWSLDDYFWHPGIRPARIIVRRKILAKIIQTYPHLSFEALMWSKKEQGNAQIDIFLA